MACDADSLAAYLKDFSGQNPIDAIICPFAGPNGAGMGMGVFALIVIAGMGLALTVRTQHPGPIMVAGILSAGLFATALPGAAANIFALVMFFGLAGVALYIYTRARATL